MKKQKSEWLQRIFLSFRVLLQNIFLILIFFFLSFLTPLHVASEKAHNDVVEVVVKHEAKVWVNDRTFFVRISLPQRFSYHENGHLSRQTFLK